MRPSGMEEASETENDRGWSDQGQQAAAAAFP